MNIIPLETLHHETLDSLFAEAGTLGAIRVWQHTDLGDRPKASFKVEIIFRSARGSKIEAVGNHSSLACAMADAINEARELGAGKQ